MTDQEMRGEIGGVSKRVPVSECHPAQWNARRAVDEKGVRELAASIEHEGLLQPLVVRETGVPDYDNPYEVICGARRLAAVKLLQHLEVPVWVVTANDAQAKVMNLAENVQRASLTPWEEAEAFQRLVNEDGLTADQVAEQIGKVTDVSYVYQRLRLLKLNAPLRKAFLAGRIGTGAALQAARLSETGQKELAEIICRPHADTESFGPRWVRNWVETHAMRELARAPWTLMQTGLYGGTCEACPKRTGNTPELFPELKGKNDQDLCLDSACWAKRTKEVIAEAKKETPGIHEIKGHEEGWRWKRKTDGPEKGIVVEDSFGSPPIVAGTIVHFNWLGKNAADSADQDKARAKSKSEGKKWRQTIEIRRRVLEAVVLKFVKETESPMVKDTAMAIEALVGRMVNDDRRFLCKALGFGAVKTQHGSSDYEKPVREYFLANRELSVMGVFAAIGAACYGTVHRGYGGKTDPLMECAERHKIDVKGIEAAVKAGPVKKEKTEAQKAVHKQNKKENRNQVVKGPKVKKAAKK